MTRNDLRKEMKSDASKLAFIFIIVGALFFVAAGAKLNAKWFVENHYIINAPCLLLIIFEGIGVLLAYGSNRLKVEKDRLLL